MATIAEKIKFGIVFMVLVGIIFAAGCASGEDSSAAYGIDSTIDSSDAGDDTGGDSSDSFGEKNILPREDSEPRADSSVSSTPGKDNKDNFVGEWRIYSEYLYYDSGGSNWLEKPSTRKLELKSNGRWTFGSSTGTWNVEEITDTDWEKWGVDSYGPRRKMVLNNWNNAGADGPIEETEDSVDFIWVIYRAEPPVVSYPGQIQMKFGHAVLS